MILLFLTYRAMHSETDDARYYCFQGRWEDRVSAEVTGTVEEICLQNGKDRTAFYLKECGIRILHGEEIWPLQRLYVSMEGKAVLVPGAKVTLRGTMYELSQAGNPGMFDQKEYYKERAVYYQMLAQECRVTGGTPKWIQAFLYRIRDRMDMVYMRSLPQKEAGLCAAITLGDKSLLDMDIRQLYQESGIGHILAISGLHVSILGLSLFRFLRFLCIPEKYAVPCCIFLVLCYGRMTDFSVSTSRAVIMMILLLMAQLLHRTYDGKSAMAFAAIVILMQKPFALYSCSFLLSFGAMGGIYFVLPVLEEIWFGDASVRRRKRRQQHRRERELEANRRCGRLITAVLRMVRQAEKMLLMSSAIQLATLPAMLYFFSETPLYGVVINLFVIPLASFAVILSFAGGAVGCVWLPAGKFFLGGVYFLLKFYEKLCLLFQKLPGHMQILGKPALWQIGVYYLLLCLILYVLWRYGQFLEECAAHKAYDGLSCRRVRRKYLGIVLPALCVALLFPVPLRQFQMVMLDVGQGDGIYLHTPQGQELLIDGGSTSEERVGRYRLLPFLKSRGIRRLDMVIATHADEDHINGLEELLQMSGDGYRIGQLLLPDVGDLAQEGYQRLIQAAKQKKVPVCFLSEGSFLTCGGVSMCCLNPQKGMQAESANDESIVLSLRYQDFSCLLTGDLAGEGESHVQEILASPAYRRKYQLPARYTVLKVAHHGSGNSTDAEMLSLIQPEYALISCGKNNRYGHPHAALLERLAEVSAKVMRTDESGAVFVNYHKGQVELRGYRNRKNK